MHLPPIEHDAGMTDDHRVEHDSMGEVRVPKDALWRAQTQRAVENFPISGTPIEPALISAMARVKAAAATANEQLDVLTPEQAQAIRDAAASIVAGEDRGGCPAAPFPH